MIISDYSVKHGTTVIVLVVIIVIMGISAYITLPRESAPDIEFPYILILANYEGASPSDMESLVTYPIERKLKSLTDVKQMTSTSSEGSISIFMEFEPEVDIDTALQKVRDKVDEATPDLPDDLDDPTVTELSSNSMFPVMFVNISGDVGLVRLKKIAEDMEEDIESVRGVLDANVLGGLEREIRVEFDHDRVSAYGLTMAEIIRTVTRNNLNTPGGSIDIGEAKYSMKIPAEFVSPDEIDNLVVAVRNGRPIYLSDVAVARDTFKDRDSFSRLSGEEAVSIKVTKRSGEHLLRIAGEIKDIIKQYESRLPHGIKFTVSSDSSKEIHTMVSDLENNILTGLILVLAVIFVSLGIRNAILVALAIPFSMLISFFILQTLGFTLNMVVLFSLILALGMLVDNAIVIVENIYRHHVNLDKPIIEAAMSGTSEVAWPVIASTATTIVAFAPLIFWPGIMGQFMSYLPKTVIIVLSASLFVAMVITPVLASLFIKKPKKKKNRKKVEKKDIHNFGLIIKSYRWILNLGLRYRILSIFFFFGLLGIVFFAYSQSGLGIELFPDTEPNRIVVKIEAPQGTNIYQTNHFSLQAEKIINIYGNIENTTVSVFNNEASITIDMVDRELRKDSGDDGRIYFSDSNKTMGAIRSELTLKIVGAVIIVDKEEQGPPVGPPVNVEITGNEYTKLAYIAGKLKSEIEDIPGIVDLTDDYKTGLPEVNVIVDKERAALMGLDAFLIGQLIKAAVNGIKIGDYREGEDEYDITARLPENQRKSLKDVMRLRVPSPTGAQVPLTSVAKIVTGSGLSTIRHIDQKRVVTVLSNVAKGFNSQQVLQTVQKTAKEGRIHLRTGDILDPGLLIKKLKEEKAISFMELREKFSEETLKKLSKYKSTGSGPSSELLVAVLDDVNKVILSPGSMWRKKISGMFPESVAPAPGPINLPPGYQIKYTGENEEQEESQAFMSRAFMIAILLITLVLVTQFNSIATPFIILASVILSFIGVFLGLIVTSQPFGIIMTGMGVISLAGVVVNNAIVLIDYINLLRKKGRSCHDAIIESCCTRFRPVILTAVTTVLGMVPMAVGISYNFRELRLEIGSDMSQWWGSMATAVIFGLVIATALTLFVVPNLYSLFFRSKKM
jgi:multidrug efflux pump